MFQRIAIEVPQSDAQRLAVARLAVALADAAARASELSKAFNRETESLTIEGHAGEDFLAALALQVSRHGNVDIPASEGHKLAQHIVAMKGDSYLTGHPEWEEIVREAEALNQ